MLEFTLTHDKKYIEVTNYDDDELLRFKKGFKKMDKSYFAKKHFMDGTWDGYESFLEGNRMVASGLWYEVHKFCMRENIPVNIKGLGAIRNAFPFDGEEEAEFDKFVVKLLDGTGISPRPYQIDAAKQVLRHKYANAELATASGKTLTLFIVASWLKWKGIISPANKLLIITSRVQLLTQIQNEFNEEYANGYMPINLIIVGGKKNPFKQKLYDGCDVCVISYQSTVSRTPDFYRCIAGVAVDEAHTAKGKSIPNVMLSCDELVVRFGVSGTIKVDEKYSTYFKIQQYLGPMVSRYSAHQLISDGFAPEVKIKAVMLNYRNVLTPDIQNFRGLLKDGKDMYDDPVAFGKEMYSIETRLIRENAERLRFIGKLVSKFDGNTLILFNDVKTEYGTRIFEMFKDMGRHCHYIDGGVSVDNRTDYTEMMERRDDMVLVASYGTYSTGVNLKNVKYIVLAESFKAEILIRQTIGRGMRPLKGKNVIYLVDIVDTFGKYSKEHFRERIQIYKRNKFELKRYEVVL